MTFNNVQVHLISTSLSGCLTFFVTEYAVSVYAKLNTTFINKCFINTDFLYNVFVAKSQSLPITGHMYIIADVCSVTT